jgi:hypothetical protein
VPVKILLSTFDLPLLIGSLCIKLLSSVVYSSSLGQPVTSQYTASVTTITAEAAIVFGGEIEVSFV